MILKYFYKGCQLPHYGNPRRACSGLPKIEKKIGFCKAGLIKDSSVSTLGPTSSEGTPLPPAGAERSEVNGGIFRFRRVLFFSVRAVISRAWGPIFRKSGNLYILLSLQNGKS